MSNLTQETYWHNLMGKSVSRFFLLACLARKPMHGYELAKEIAIACNQCCSPSDAMIYPAIRELKLAGLITTHEEKLGGRVRKICSLTPEGHRAYQTAAKVWGAILPGLNDTVARGLEITLQEG
ncbi:MAG: PadR family transcriptional regulator [Candidatus Eisenbacteria bacterium]|uniref:PadR family transcriptional regulator n=1 Tax=Eiseniibacteriota bacterium TaxID=2212470 RepID=A0A7Y2H430_UNCEI|nr:PadR family transcriptional regulator [Candidatus Eisenbacteria bacterium]